MKTLILERKPTTHTHTEGFLLFNGITLCTIERPWIPTDAHPGGTPFHSCVPDGTYELILHARPNGQLALALINPDLGVYYQEDDMPPEGGRYLVLIHAGNWVTDVVGCIAPGLSRTVSSKGLMVTNSRAAMRHILEFVDNEPARIHISWINGAGDTP